MRTIETKGQFAKRKHRSPSCVSAWIAEGKISSGALVGEGHRARIWVEQADADLAEALHPSQQWSKQFPANERSSFLPASLAPLSSMDAVDRPSGDGPIAVSDLEMDRARRAKADANRAEHEAEAARRKLALDEGKWMVAEDAAREWTRTLRDIIAGFETFLTVTLARDLAYKHGLDLKPLTVEMREAFRKHRGEVSAAAHEEAAKLTDLVEEAGFAPGSELKGAVRSW